MFKQEKVEYDYNNLMKNNGTRVCVGQKNCRLNVSWSVFCVHVVTSPPSVVIPDGWKHFRWDLFSY